jgi:hypothetical protein
MRADSGTRAVKCLSAQGRRPARDPSRDLHPYLAHDVRVRRGPRRIQRPLGVSAAWSAAEETIETIGTLRSLEREGRLAITEAAGGVVIGVANPDEPAPASRYRGPGSQR